MSGLAEWRPIAFEPSVERQYVALRLERVVPLARLGSVIGGLAFLGYGAWDLLLDPQALSRTGPIRLAVAALFAATYAMTYWRVVRSSSAIWLALVLTNYLAVAIGYSLILRELPEGFLAGVSGFILGMIFVPVLVITSTQAIIVLLPLIAAPLLFMYGQGATTFEIINAAAWIGGGGFFAIGFTYLVDAINRRSFQLERSLEIERQRSETLLLNILPAKIAERLKATEATIADDFPSATVLFADIVGFTVLSRRLTAAEVVALLNDLFSRFDRLALAHGIEKIKTIGDGYMAAAGVPAGRPDHAEAVARLALDMREAFAAFRRERGMEVKLRIGIHSGGIVAGVIGKHKFAYDLWGDTVNVASRMESHGLPDEIQVSAETRALLPDTCLVEERGMIEIKGHAARRTYLLKRMVSAAPGRVLREG
jgi:class 3 adenylate cyclase